MMSELVLLPYPSSAAQPAIHWLRAQVQADVITLTLDLGQGGDLVEVRESALAGGALRAHVIDAREEFARAFLLPALHAGTLRGRPTALTRELAGAIVARRAVEVARMERARTVACPGEAEDAARLEVSVRALDPALTIVRLPAFLVCSSPDGFPRVAANLWGRCIEDDGTMADVRRAYTLTREPAECPDEPALVEIEFDRGVPVRANGIDMSLLELIESLEIIAGAHGVGRLGPGSTRGGAARAGWMCEAPAAVVLDEAHRALETVVFDDELRFLKRQAAGLYANLLEGGRCFSPAREAIDAFVSALQQHVSGTVRMELFKSRCRSVAVRAHPPPATATSSGCGGEPQDAVAPGARDRRG